MVAFEGFANLLFSLLALSTFGVIELPSWANFLVACLWGIAYLGVVVCDSIRQDKIKSIETDLRAYKKEVDELRKKVTKLESLTV